MKKKVLLIHGPNLNLLGSREVSKYGLKNSEEIVSGLKAAFPDYELDYFQSNHESELVDRIQSSKKEYSGILINAGAFSHTSIAIADAIRAINMPVINIHISNIYQRESFRHTDIVGEACKGSIVGLGVEGYALAMDCLSDHL